MEPFKRISGVVGPLIEVPALVMLVYVSLWAGKRFFRAFGPSTGREDNTRRGRDAAG